MLQRINAFLDVASEFIAHRKGLLPLIGLGLVVLNLILQLFSGLGWLVSSNLFLHLGLIIVILGVLLARAL